MLAVLYLSCRYYHVDCKPNSRSVCAIERERERIGSFQGAEREGQREKEREKERERDRDSEREREFRRLEDAEVALRSATQMDDW